MFDFSRIEPKSWRRASGEHLAAVEKYVPGFRGFYAMDGSEIVYVGRVEEDKKPYRIVRLSNSGASPKIDSGSAAMDAYRNVFAIKRRKKP